MDANSKPSCNRATDPETVPDSSLGQISHWSRATAQDSCIGKTPVEAHISCTSPWSQVVSQVSTWPSVMGATDINTKPQLHLNHKQSLAFACSPGPDMPWHWVAGRASILTLFLLPSPPQTHLSPQRVSCSAFLSVPVGHPVLVHHNGA